MIAKRPSTNKTDIFAHKLDTLLAYPRQPIILDLYASSGSVLTLKPGLNRNDVDDYVVWINGVVYEDLYTGTDDTINLANTGLGGIIDGITFVAANARDFLIWGVANNSNNGFSGFACTHKPYSTYTSPATANKGVEYTFAGLTNATQFTVGAKVVVRNTVTNAGNPFPYNKAPHYEWNWGVITEIVSNTSIKILMDNNAAYGVSLTGATGGEILQWDKYRPWVVGSSQSLYSNNYRLLGEINTDTSGNIIFATRVDSPWRPHASNKQFYDNTLSSTVYTVSLGRDNPLWIKQIKMVGIARDTTSTTGVTFVYPYLASAGFQILVSTINELYRELANVDCGSYGRMTITPNTATRNALQFFTYAYYVPGGMRI